MNGNPLRPAGRPDIARVREVIGTQVARAVALTSSSLCRDNDMNMIVFNLSDEGNIARVVAGEKIGTTLAAFRMLPPWYERLLVPAVCSRA